MRRITVLLSFCFLTALLSINAAICLPYRTVALVLSILLSVVSAILFWIDHLCFRSGTPAACRSLFRSFGRFAAAAASAAAAAQAAGKKQPDKPRIDHGVPGVGGDGAGPGGAACQRVINKPHRRAARGEKDGPPPFFPEFFHHTCSSPVGMVCPGRESACPLSRLSVCCDTSIPIRRPFFCDEVTHIKKGLPIPGSPQKQCMSLPAAFFRLREKGRSMRPEICQHRHRKPPFLRAFSAH